MANRLANATSPYLQQHAGNPVDWWEWGPEAFEEARRRDAPILLSVGYAACHWCHVMAHESFEDEATAAYLNEHYVSVKVDREERPDVDAVYMQATVAMTGQGGWPMTCVLDHEGRPFFAGTYFPDRPRHGQPAFTQVLQALADAWATRRDEVANVAAGIQEHLAKEGSLGGGAPVDEALLDAAVEGLRKEFDGANAGFGGAPKFPPSMLLEFLLRRAASTGGRGPALPMAEVTLRAMAGGGIYDQLGGGFARYAVDARWVVPHFEKMLYDNALLLAAYTSWYAVSNDPLARRIATETAEFVIRELGTPEGGFASALDADSEGEEGTFYVWTPEQLREVLGDEDGHWAAELLGVTEAGTFEHGTSTLQLRAAPDDANRWETIKAKLFEARAHRVRPERDDKVVAAWNGLAIAALARAAGVLQEDRFLAAAVAAGELLRDVHIDGEAIKRVSRDGIAGAPEGVLEDYGCVADGFLALAEATADDRWLEAAGHLLDAAIDRFAADDGGFYDTAADAEALIARPRDPSDNASPSGFSATVGALVRYAALTGSGRHRDVAEAAIGSVHALIERAPRFAGWSLATAQAMLDGPREIVVVGDSKMTGDLAERARRLPGAIVMAVTPDQVAGSRIPLLEGRTAIDGRPTAYVCRGMVCRAPVHDVAGLEAQL